MGLFGRGKKKTEPPPPPQPQAPRPQADFLSPLWSQWPPAAEAAPAPPPPPAPLVTPPPPRAQGPLITPPPPPRAPLALPEAIEAIDVEAELVIESPLPPAPPAPAFARPPSNYPPPGRPPSNYPPPGRPLSNHPPPVPGPAVVVQRVQPITGAPPPPAQPPAPAAPPAPPPARPSSIPQVMPRRQSSRPAPAAAYGPAELMRQAMARGDFLSARAIADKVLAYDPTDLEAHACLQACDHRLSQSWESRLGDRDRVLRIAVPTDWLSQLAIDPRVAYVVSRIDGVTSIQSVLDVSGMAEADCAKVLLDLLDEGVLEIRPPLPRISSYPPR